MQQQYPMIRRTILTFLVLFNTHAVLGRSTTEQCYQSPSETENRVSENGFVGPKNQNKIGEILGAGFPNIGLRVCHSNERSFLYLNADQLYSFDLKNDSFSSFDRAEAFEASPDCTKLAAIKPFSNGSLVLLNSSNLQVLSQIPFKGSFQSILFWLDNDTLQMQAGDDSASSLLTFNQGKVESILALPFKIRAKSDKSSLDAYFISSNGTENFRPDGRPQITFEISDNGPQQKTTIEQLDSRYQHYETLESLESGQFRFYVRTPNESGLYSEILVYDIKSGSLVDKFLGKNIQLQPNGGILYLKPIAAREHNLAHYTPTTRSHKEIIRTIRGKVTSFDSSNGLVFAIKDELTEQYLISSDSLSTTRLEVAVPGKNAGEIIDRIFAWNSKKELCIPFVSQRKIGSEDKGTIIYAHGGGPNFSGDYSSNSIHSVLVPFLEEGYTIVSVSHHGSSILSLGNYMNLEPDQERHPRDYFKDESEDFLAIEKEVLKRTSKPVIWFGHSNGSSTLNAYLTQKKNEVKAKCAISYAGLWDYRLLSNVENADVFTWYVSNYSPGPQTSVTDHGYGNTWQSPNADPVLYGSYEKAKARLDELNQLGKKDSLVFYRHDEPEFSTRNPIDHLRNITIPVFSIGGSEDAIFRGEHRQIKKTIDTLGIENIKVKEYQGSGHSTWPDDTGYNDIVQDVRSFIGRHCL